MSLFPSKLLVPLEQAGSEAWCIVIFVKKIDSQCIKFSCCSKICMIVACNPLALKSRPCKNVAARSYLMLSHTVGIVLACVDDKDSVLYVAGFTDSCWKLLGVVVVCS